MASTLLFENLKSLPYYVSSRDTPSALSKNAGVFSEPFVDQLQHIYFKRMTIPPKLEELVS